MTTSRFGAVSNRAPLLSEPLCHETIVIKEVVRPTLPSRVVEVAALTAFLAPFLPYLYRAGQTLAEDAGRKRGSRGLGHAKRLWAGLRPSIEAKQSREAAEELAARPEDERARAALELQLEKLLEADAGLAGDFAAMGGGKAAKTSSSPVHAASLSVATCLAA